MTRLLLAAGLLLWSASVFAQSVGCDDNFVQRDGPQILVEATGADDTANILCALEQATQRRIPTVRLASGSFSVSHLQVEKFEGGLRGTTRQGSILNVLDNSIDCAGLMADGQVPSAIKFIGGSPFVGTMRINTGSPCNGGSVGMFSVLHFTGEPSSSSSCGNDVIFGFVDRVDMVGTGPLDYPLTAAEAQAEGARLGGCNQTLLGTFKFNRSTVTNHYVAVHLGMRGRGQVDVNFNEFTDNRMGVLITDASQLATIQSNEFSNAGLTVTSEAIQLLANRGDIAAPGNNRLVVHNNDFEYWQGGEFVYPTIISLFQSPPLPDLSFVATSNDFLAQGTNVLCLSSAGVSGGQMANNRASGGGQTCMSVGGFEVTDQLWLFNGNSFGQYNASLADIYLGPMTQNMLVGDGPNTSVVDEGTGNTVLASGSGSATQ